MIKFISSIGIDMFYIKNDNIYLWAFNTPINDEFINILEREQAYGVEFKPSFNEDISRLPNCIKLIRFALNSEFNQPLDYLPFGLKKLIINAEFNYPLDNLPASLEYLEIRGGFNYPLNNLPSNLKVLLIKDIYDYDDYHIRKAIIRHCSSSQFNQPIYRLPKSLEIIEILDNLKLNI